MNGLVPDHTHRVQRLLERSTYCAALHKLTDCLVYAWFCRADMRTKLLEREPKEGGSASRRVDINEPSFLEIRPNIVGHVRVRCWCTARPRPNQNAVDEHHLSVASLAPGEPNHTRSSDLAAAGG